MIQKNLTTCDWVFEQLTAGPLLSDPVDDHGIELHLRCCHECRTLAEAMRPAIGMAHDSLSEAARHDLPSYTSNRLPDDDPILSSVRTAISKRHHCASDDGQKTSRANSNGLNATEPASRTFKLILLALAAIVLISISGTTGFFLGMAALSPDDANNGAEIRLRRVAVENKHLSKGDLIKFAKSTSCSTAEELAKSALSNGPHPIAIASLRSLCCTECHTTSHQTLKQDYQVAAIVRSCHQCHMN